MTMQRRTITQYRLGTAERIAMQDHLHSMLPVLGLSPEPDGRSPVEYRAIHRLIDGEWVEADIVELAAETARRCQEAYRDLAGNADMPAPMREAFAANIERLDRALDCLDRAQAVPEYDHRLDAVPPVAR